MDKEESNKMKKEGDEMSLPLNKTQKSLFSDFVSQHGEQIQQLSDANWKKNSDGKYIITKDDSWRQEHEWDELNKELNRKK